MPNLSHGRRGNPEALKAGWVLTARAGDKERCISGESPLQKLVVALTDISQANQVALLGQGRCRAGQPIRHTGLQRNAIAAELLGQSLADTDERPAAV